MSLLDGIWLAIRECMPLSTLSNMNISDQRASIIWDGGNAALGFGSDRIRALVSMATDSFHRVIMGKTVFRFLKCFDPILFILAGNKELHKSSKEFEIRPDPTTDFGVSCH